ncbi:3-dehydroquinate synthase II [Niallia sp. 03133]|uniref:3-dehydroquinate synthase II n=1 Tax=Niallia sp. 03133 TaxID=3458060 RepID=UPI004043A4AC
MDKLIWFDARDNLDNLNEIILTVNQSSNFDGILYNAFQLKEVYHSDRLKIACFIEVEAEWNELLEREEHLDDIVIISPNEQILSIAKERGLQTGLYMYIDNEQSMERAHIEGKKNGYVIVEFKDETNIPLELIIAQLQQSQTRIIKSVHTLDDAKVSKEVMEVGCDGLLIRTDQIQTIMGINTIIEENKHSMLDVVRLKVTNVEHLGPGKRACIDTTTLLTKEEAMIVGSTSSGGLLVCSETHYLPYMNTRPFRVNAGAVHSYVWCPNDKTEYITDLKVGSEVQIIDIHGNVRTANVGRVKIEVRPLLLIEAEYDGYSINTIVQDDWHIRIFDGNGQPKNSTRFRVGDEVLAYVCEPGRHVGIKIAESIAER